MGGKKLHEPSQGARPKGWRSASSPHWRAPNLGSSSSAIGHQPSGRGSVCKVVIEKQRCVSKLTLAKLSSQSNQIDLIFSSSSYTSSSFVVFVLDPLLLSSPPVQS
ncbi:hypothetical protein CRG98_025107 [Punica granatum]|uniref:Uncharacterized protein n=1 Tax=Punica granatum TaxID=22663 RepID=A0A2I0JF20_PUNGR|nr:hypothetical protein CRG98_025107 [Punica granatum]